MLTRPKQHGHGRFHHGLRMRGVASVARIARQCMSVRATFQQPRGALPPTAACKTGRKPVVVTGRWRSSNSGCKGVAALPKGFLFVSSNLGIGFEEGGLSRSQPGDGSRVRLREVNHREVRANYSICGRSEDRHRRLHELSSSANTVVFCGTQEIPVVDLSIAVQRRRQSRQPSPFYIAKFSDRPDLPTRHFMVALSPPHIGRMAVIRPPFYSALIHYDLNDDGFARKKSRAFRRGPRTRLLAEGYGISSMVMVAPPMEGIAAATFNGLRESFAIHSVCLSAPPSADVTSTL